MTEHETDLTRGIRRRALLARELRGLSRRATRSELGASGATQVYRIETGAQLRLTVRLLVALCRRYSLSLHDLVLGWDGWARAEPPVPPVSTWPDGLSPERLEAIVQSNVRRQRTARGLGTPALAQAVGIWQSDLYRYETGERRLPIDVVERLAVALEVPILTLFLEPAADV